MNIPVALLLIPYGLFLIFFTVMLLSALYHIIRFDFINPTTITVSFLFLLVAVILLAVSFKAINAIDWSYRITLSANNFTSEQTNTNEFFSL